MHWWMFSVKNDLCNCDMDSVFSVKTLENAVTLVTNAVFSVKNAVFSVKNAVFSVKNAVKVTKFVMTYYKMSLQIAMSELMKLVDKITDVLGS